MSERLRANGRAVELGTPNQVSHVGGREVRMRDELGISLDPHEHAKPGCSTCRGNGVLERRRSWTPEMMKTVGVDPAQVKRASNNWLTDLAVCGCVMPRYQRARAAVAVWRRARCAQPER